MARHTVGARELKTRLGTYLQRVREGVYPRRYRPWATGGGVAPAAHARLLAFRTAQVVDNGRGDTADGGRALHVQTYPESRSLRI